MKPLTKSEMLAFSTPEKWKEWLKKNHALSQGIWLQFYKKNSKKKTIVYSQALDIALCYGWIDSQTKSIDEHSYMQKFTPRRRKSLWSKRNTEYVLRLIEEGKMMPAGLKEVELAKQDGRWHAAYDAPSKSVMPEDFLVAVRKNKKAEAFLQTLNKANLYAITWRLQTAKKPETREKRMKVILEMLAKGERFHE